MSNVTSNAACSLSKTVFICTAMPSENLRCQDYLERCCIFALRMGAYPIAPLLFFDDEFDLSDRHVKKMIQSWMRGCIRQASEIWVFGDKARGKYKAELNRQAGLGKRIRYFGNGEDGEFTLKRIVGNEVKDVHEAQVE